MQGSNTLPGNAEKEGKGGVKGWINKLTSHKVNQEYGGQTSGDVLASVEDRTGDGLDAYRSGSRPNTNSIEDGKTGDGVDIHRGVSEPTTDSGAAVRSTSDGPAHSFRIPALSAGKESDSHECGHSMGSTDSL